MKNHILTSNYLRILQFVDYFHQLFSQSYRVSLRDKYDFVLCICHYKYRKIINNPESDWIIVENTHEAIIDKETFEKVQSLLPKQNQRTD